MAKRSRLTRRIVTPYYILLTIVIAVSMAFVYSAIVSRTKSDAEVSNRAIADMSAEQVGVFVNELGVIADQVNRRSDITGVFYSLSGDTNAENFFESDVLSAIDVSSALLGIVMDRAADYNICVYNGYGDYISSHAYMTDSEKIGAIPTDAEYLRRITYMDINGGSSVLVPQKDPVSFSNKLFVTVRKPLKNDYSDTVYGIIEARGNAERLGALIDVENTISVIRNRISKEVIYRPSENEEIGQYYVSSPIEGTDWEVVISYPEPVSTVYILKILSVFIIIFIFLSAFILIITMNMGRTVTRPITQIVRRVGEINSPAEKLSPVDEEAIDEIKELENSFDKMMKRVDESSKQEKKAYAMALQAQMNPHFLYNSLAVIGAYGAESGSEKVADMCVRLSDMLRYVASYEKTAVPLFEEIAQTENYLSLMKARYEDGFEYEIDVDDELKSMVLPKLTIQPLAENCFKHGFKMSLPPWRISVKMRGDENAWTLEIRDNGVGISDEKTEQVRRKIEMATETMSLSDIGGVGLVNTVVRLRLAGGKDISYFIENDNGTVIRISCRDI